MFNSVLSFPCSVLFLQLHFQCQYLTFPCSLLSRQFPYSIQFWHPHFQFSFDISIFHMFNSVLAMPTFNDVLWHSQVSILFPQFPRSARFFLAFHCSVQIRSTFYSIFIFNFSLHSLYKFLTKVSMSENLWSINCISNYQIQRLAGFMITAPNTI